MSKPFFDTEGPIAVAHRGGDGAGWNKRNTMAAFKSAHQLGYKYQETDVIDTKDRQVIIAHGGKTWLEAKLRGTFTFRTLQNLSYEEIKHQLKIDSEPIPLLRDVLQAFPATRFFIDPKTDTVVEPLAELLLQHKALDRVLINSFEYSRLKRAQEILGDDAQLGLLIGRHLNLIHKLYRLRQGRLSHLEDLAINYWLASKGRIKLIHSQDLKAVVWTPDTAKSIKRVLDNGADAVISDRTELLKQTILSLNPDNKSFR